MGKRTSTPTQASKREQDFVAIMAKSGLRLQGIFGTESEMWVPASRADSSPTPATEAKPRKKSKKQLEHARVTAANKAQGRVMTTARYVCDETGCAGYWYHEAKAQAHTGKTGHKTSMV